MTIEIIYETHATTLDNESGIASGWLPGELSDAGAHKRVIWGSADEPDGSMPCSFPT